MNKFLSKLVMLLFFILFVMAGWAALTMSFPVVLWNILLAIVSLFFLFRALEMVDKINGLGTYSNQPDNLPRDMDHPQGYHNEFPGRHDTGRPGTGPAPHSPGNGYPRREEPITRGGETPDDDFLVPDEE